MPDDIHICFAARCERLRENNGVVQAFFTRHADFTGSESTEEHALINVKREDAKFELGKLYWIDIRPAFPTS